MMTNQDKLYIVVNLADKQHPPILTYYARVAPRIGEMIVYAIDNETYSYIVTNVEYYVQAGEPADTSGKREPGGSDEVYLTVKGITQ